ncbi:hypothetical protein COCC4DRAFT_75992 [Bipolaris maydis ATCC 48331]|uniref:Rhodopsin domain-containing protein n=2 Tax=Cochliobolus heterostrophus TaxID=5016 RepID=M2TUH2_COCH5|nr:uncharacterized protein COCC4DRAFT_75992 [Bipolaris maydis ATCC 48331]EMD85386.1 hypothetical protein COCHEDRAFT_1149059 [Bipolaris maydis C5]KAJ5058019.1 hypothetical protein J3E74DRAFT_277404 [Bipolaris maydis]ENI00220.1 hypothetical protein COCC4DRAFT_75992 [Bipolaris maydis ATCC 48331]KAJ6207341.1 hypothetical protein PSV09DRAFT_1149059 [Bipolaris maydis]KAJ6268165.1 hypothetical protein PSV08DRAFT_227358 [Bipolaris maydis]
MAPARDDKFLPEVWGLYSVGALWLLLRFAVRLRTVGVMGLQLDDGFAFVALIAWTYTCAITDIIYHTGTNTDYSAAEIALFNHDKFAEVEFSSKLFLGSWYAYIVLIFSLKGVVIMLYRRIFLERWQTYMLRFTVFLCLSGFTATTLALSLSCLPYHQRWQLVPHPPLVCTASPKILILASCLNATTDVFLLSIPVPLLWQLNKPLHIRFGIFSLLASGLFVLAACITRVSLTVVPNIFVLNIARWGIREFCIAIVAVNSACLQPLFHRSFWSIRKPHPANRSNRNYVFASAQRARQRFTRARNRSHVLDSTSAGASISNASMKQANFEQEHVGRNSILENPRYEVASDQLQNDQHGSGMETISVIKNLGELDVEKGDASLTRQPAQTVVSCYSENLR